MKQFTFLFVRDPLSSIVIFRPPPSKRSKVDDETEKVRNRLNNSRILYRNFEACVHGADISQDPCDRPTYNEATTPTPLHPMTRDLGQL